MEPEQITRARTPRGGRPPVKPDALLCGNCDFVTFNSYELQGHFKQTGHKEPGSLSEIKKLSMELPLYIALIFGGAILFGAVIAALIWSAKILVSLGVPALYIFVWWIRRDGA